MSDFGIIGFVGDHDHSGIELQGLSDQELRRAAGHQHRHLEGFTMAADDLQGLRPDRARRAEDGDPFLLYHYLLRSLSEEVDKCLYRAAHRVERSILILPVEVRSTREEVGTRQSHIREAGAIRPTTDG